VFPWFVLALWLVTATFGLRELIGWRRSPDKPPPVAYRHLTTALTGLGLWAAFVLSGATALAWLTFGVLFLNNNWGDGVLTTGWRSRNPALATWTWRDHLSANWEIVRFGRSPGVTAHAWLAGAVFFSVLGTAVASTF
jgi:hypothetical protein